MKCQEYSGSSESEIKSVKFIKDGVTEIISVYVQDGSVYSENITEHQKTVIEALIHCNAKYSKINMFGDWAVNEDGDIINTNRHCSRYPVYKERYDKSETKIIEHLGSKTWFDDFQKETFRQALKYAKKNYV